MPQLDVNPVDLNRSDILQTECIFGVAIDRPGPTRLLDYCHASSSARSSAICGTQEPVWVDGGMGVGLAGCCAPSCWTVLAVFLIQRQPGDAVSAARYISRRL